MAILTTTAFTNALKVLYPSGLEEAFYADNPALAWVPKTYNFEGASKQINPWYSGIRGSSDFTTALAAKSTPNIAKFNVTRVKDYVIGSIDNEAIKASQSQKGAVARALKTQMDSALYEFGRSAAFQLWGDGTGTRGTVSSFASSQITLTQRRDVVNFEVGMVLKLKNSGGTLLTGTQTITAIDRDSGLLTVSANGGAANPAANDTIARDGDYTSTGGNVLSGFLAWIPVTDPTSTAFFGVDRTADLVRLSGIRVSGGLSIEEVVFNAQAELSMNGGRADTLWMNSQRYADLMKSLQGKAWYSTDSKSTMMSSRGQSGKVKVGFPGFVFPGERGPIQVLPDPNCPYAYGLLTRRDSWELACLGGCPEFAEDDGRKFLRESSADAIEFRLRCYWQLCNHRPMDSVLITWDS